MSLVSAPEEFLNAQALLSRNLAVVILRVRVTLSFSEKLVVLIVLLTRLRVLWPSGRLGVKLFLLLRLADSLCPPSIVPSVRHILVFTCSVAPKLGVLTGVTTNLRTLILALVRVLLPMTPTTGIGSIRVRGLLRQWNKGRLVDLVVVWVIVREMFRTVPVFKWPPPGAVLRLTTSRLTNCRLEVL